MKIAITGPPQSGKSTIGRLLASVLEIEQFLQTDALTHLAWSEASEMVSRWFDLPGPWIIEGVVVPRAIRKWKQRLEDENADKSRKDTPPWDKILVLRHPHRPLLPGQQTMGKQVLGLIDQYKDWSGETWLDP